MSRLSRLIASRIHQHPSVQESIRKRIFCFRTPLMIYLIRVFVVSIVFTKSYSKHIAHSAGIPCSINESPDQPVKSEDLSLTY